ncbi:tetratricopeptide repeat protein [Paraburkholderia sp. SIMBA_050]|uniref:protein O-GlcNAc transferase n=1 Tax=Paraburkholderia terricola TaxID=169427 RepID=A0A1M6LGE5_9BURK|nr:MULTISPECIES: tetratricopeptide repeat protein [Paraburkholderia]SDN86341.1 Predicted O-linked N-acetylglucosamine transferase, SPINDLY family [Paraburkholderia sediminicola]SHJ70283.1 Predicted O-linked N-acetylglucosamine transferase, SPINDLY family [Paraburkholderia terricola]
MTLLTEQPTAETLTPEQQLEHDIALVLQAALQLHHKGEFDDAEALYKAILEAKPAHGDVLYNLGVLCVQCKRPADGLPYLEAALGGAPNNGQFWVAYINALIDAGQTQAAWLALEMGQQRGLKGPAVNGLITRMAHDGGGYATSAVASVAAAPAPTVPAAAEADQETAAAKVAASDTRRPTPQEMNRFNTLFNKGHISDAIKLGRSLAERFPAHGPAWRSLGIALHRGGQYVEAIAALKTGISLGSDDAEARKAVADLLRVTGQHADAEAECRKLLALNPDYSEGHRVLGLVLSARGEHREAIAECRRAAELTPEYGESHGTLGVVLLDYGASQEAESSFRRALDLEPRNAMTRSNLLFSIAHNPDIDTEQIYAEHRKYAQVHEASLRLPKPRHTNSRAVDRTLKVGIVSGDLFRHAVSSYLMPVMEPLAQDEGLALHVYYNHIVEDDYTQRLRGYAKQWRNVSSMTDEAFIAQVRADKIDILIDLSGHTGRNRLQAFARKPAPIQASWIGYPATTGLDAMDYYLSDRFFTPFGDIERQFSEKLVHLAAIGPFQPEKNAPPVNILPAMHNGYITFGSFNRLNKLRPDVIALWAKLLRELPTARMVLGSMSGDDGDENLVNWFANEGISRDRLSFRPRSTIAVYLQQHYQVDICLDTFPYTGSTTVLNSLWMGVPTLTMAGKTMASRAAAAWLSHSGLQAFVAGNADDFVAKGVELAADIPALASLRTSLRERCMASPAFQPERVANSLSSALRTMWRRWCDGLAPAAFSADGTQPASNNPVHATPR